MRDRLSDTATWWRSSWCGRLLHRNGWVGPQASSRRMPLRLEEKPVGGFTRIAGKPVATGLSKSLFVHGAFPMVIVMPLGAVRTTSGGLYRI